MHGETKLLNCVRSSITPEKLSPEGKKTIVQCAWLGQAIHSVCSQSHYRSDSPKERRLSSSVHRVEKPFCAFLNHTREIVAGRKEDNRPVRMARSSHSFCVFPVILQKKRRLSASVHGVEKPFVCSSITPEKLRGKHGEKKPFVRSSITPEKLERKARRGKVICAFFSHTRKIGEASTE